MVELNQAYTSIFLFVLQWACSKVCTTTFACDASDAPDMSLSQFLSLSLSVVCVCLSPTHEHALHQDECKSQKQTKKVIYIPRNKQQN